MRVSVNNVLIAAFFRHGLRRMWPTHRLVDENYEVENKIPPKVYNIKFAVPRYHLQIWSANLYILVPEHSRSLSNHCNQD